MSNCGAIAMSDVVAARIYNARMTVYLCAAVIFLITSDGLFLTFGEVKVTSGKLLAIAFGFMLFLSSMLRGRVSVGGMAGVMLLLWICLSFVTSIVHSSTAGVYKHLANICASLIWFYVIVNARIEWFVVRSSVMLFSVFIGAVSVFVLAIRYSIPDYAPLFDALFQYEAGTDRLLMFSWEPNIFGATIAITLLMFLPALCHLSRVRYFIVFIALLCALLASFSKGPFLMFGVGLLTYVILTREKNAKKLLLILSIFSLFALVLLTITRPDFLETELIRMNNINVRLTQIEYAIMDIGDSPWIGNGTFSFGGIWPSLNYQFGSDEAGSAWIGQAPIGILHDTGVLGMVFMLLFWFAILWRAISSIMCLRHHNIQNDFLLFLCALLSSVVSLMLQDWITTLYSLPMYWAVMGVVACIPNWTVKYIRQYNHAID